MDDKQMEKLLRIINAINYVLENGLTNGVSEQKQEYKDAIALLGTYDDALKGK